MDSSVSPKDEIWFLRVCHHISNAVYLQCGVIDIGTDVSGVYRSNDNTYHRHNFRPNSGATSFSDVENRSVMRIINVKSHLVYTRVQAKESGYQGNETGS